MWEFIVLLVVLLLWGVKLQKKGEWIENPWSLHMAKAMQGIAAIGIVFHHSSQKLLNVGSSAGALVKFADFGVLFVGIFFFFSGYGLVKSYKTKPDYFNHFFRNRYAALLIPFFLTNVVYYIVSLFQGASYSEEETLRSLLGIQSINDQVWFVIEIFIFYLVFFLIYRWSKHEVISLIAMNVYIVGFMVFCILQGHGYHWFQGEWWYNTSLLFGVGLLFATFEDKILKFIKKTYVVLLPIFVIATYVLYRVNIYCLENISYWSEYPGHPGYDDKLKCLSAQLPMIVCFVITILLIMCKVHFGNKALAFLGKMSLEIYLIQNVFLVNLRTQNKLYIKNDDLYVAAVLGCTIVSAFLLHLIGSWLIKKIRVNKK